MPDVNATSFTILITARALEYLRGHLVVGTNLEREDLERRLDGRMVLDQQPVARVLRHLSGLGVLALRPERLEIRQSEGEDGVDIAALECGRQTVVFGLNLPFESFLSRAGAANEQRQAYRDGDSERSAGGSFCA